MNFIKNFLKGIIDDSIEGLQVAFKRKVLVICLAILVMLFFWGWHCLIPPTQQVVGKVNITGASFAKVCRESHMEDGYQPVVDSCTESILLTGKINSQMVAEFEQRIAENEISMTKVDTVCFYSNGGHTASALAIYDLIRQSNFKTCVGDYIKVHLPIGADEKLKAKVEEVERKAREDGVQCSSSCPFALLAGAERIGKGVFKISVHSPGVTWYCWPCVGERFSLWSIAHGDFKDMSNTEDKSTVDGFKRFYNTAVAHPFTENDLLVISNKDLIEMKVFTKIED